jgi:hypothetical protein
MKPAMTVRLDIRESLTSPWPGLSDIFALVAPADADRQPFDLLLSARIDDFQLDDVLP